MLNVPTDVIAGSWKIVSGLPSYGSDTLSGEASITNKKNENLDKLSLSYHVKSLAILALVLYKILEIFKNSFLKYIPQLFCYL